MKRAFSLLIVLTIFSGCTFYRKSTTTIDLEDGQYGLAKADGEVLHEAETAFSLFCKDVKQPHH